MNRGNDVTIGLKRKEMQDGIRNGLSLLVFFAAITLGVVLESWLIGIVIFMLGLGAISYWYYRDV